MREKIIKFIVSLGYIGYSRFAPGTAGCLVGVVIFISFVRDNLFNHIVLVIVFLCTGLLLSRKAEIIFGERDSKKIVIDDAAGLFIALFGISYSIKTIIFVFLVYRLIDIFKPPPIKRLEHLPLGMGIMLDDIIAGFYANIITILFLALTHNKIRLPFF